MPQAISFMDTGYGAWLSAMRDVSDLDYMSLLRAKIVENLAVVNYDTNNLHLAPYDWRLSFYNLETRDAYFSKLKATIEGFRFVQSHPRFDIWI